MSTDQYHSFRSTLLSMIDGVSQEENRDIHLKTFCDYYVPPLRSYLQRTLGKRYGLSSQELDDVLQDFLLTKILDPKSESNNLPAKFLERKVDAPSTTFRGYLIRAVNRFVIDRLRKKQQQHVALYPEHGADESEVDHFVLDWGERLLRLALKQMEEQCKQDNRADLWNVFDARFVAPFAANEKPKSLEEIGEIMGFAEAKAKKTQNLLETAKRRFRRIVRKLVVSHVPKESIQSDDELFHQELGNLLKSAARANVIVSPGASDSLTVLQLAQEDLALEQDDYTVADYAAIWKDINQMELEDFVAEVAPSLKVKFKDVVVWGGEKFSVVADLWQHPSPPTDLLQSIKSFAKQAGKERSSRAYPYEINVVLYHAAIATCWLKTETIITRDGPELIRRKLPKLLEFDWLDDTMRDLFGSWLEQLEVA